VINYDVSKQKIMFSLAPHWTTYTVLATSMGADPDISGGGVEVLYSTIAVYPRAPSQSIVQQ